MTDLSPREKALVEALKAYIGPIPPLDSVSQQNGWLPEFCAVVEALRAYDPPKPKVPQIPAWEEFAQGRFTSTTGRIELDENVWIDRFQYEVIRTLTSKEAE